MIFIKKEEYFIAFYMICRRIKSVCAKNMQKMNGLQKKRGKAGRLIRKNKGNRSNG